MAYADYTFYTDDFLGSAIAATDFPRLALRASASIDEITFGRAAAVTDEATLTKIKNAMCAVAEELQTQEQNANVDAVTSESQGRYSVSYAANSSRALTNAQKIQNAARTWLSGTYLTFAGFADGEYAE
jgi:hypothetical protein